MPTAVILCGQARFFRDTYQSIKNTILDVYTPDVYIHTWKHSNDIAYSAPWNRFGDIKISENDINDYIALYNPVKYNVQSELTNAEIDLALKKDIYKNTSSPETKYNYYSYLYSLRQCYRLIDSPEKYDSFIVLRSDAYMYTFPEPSKIKIQVWNRLPNRTDGVIEAMVCIVPKQYMVTFVNIIDKLDDYYDKGYKFNYEEMTYAHLKETHLYDYIELLPTKDFEFGLQRKNIIENIFSA